ncbi:hypothetical protein EIP91_005687 [Steccherinum ochraceum]|uniref:Uncharacterized protein n=1 Tax=Steccherinum ochraceum TaxID=92696 RepID=A0A4R0R9F7_9APHY|nr:hypothetical protein EIP91_005687 [Steccherinum ochraceum]
MSSSVVAPMLLSNANGDAAFAPHTDDTSPISPLSLDPPTLHNLADDPIIPTTDPTENTVPPPTAQLQHDIPSPIPQTEADLRAAVDAIIHKAESQMKMLDSIHEAMQRELNDMFDRHDNVKKGARKLGEMMRLTKESSESEGDSEGGSTH